MRLVDPDDVRLHYRDGLHDLLQQAVQMFLGFLEFVEVLVNSKQILRYAKVVIPHSLLRGRDLLCHVGVKFHQVFQVT